MLSKDDLISIGYTFSPDLHQPELFSWDNEEGAFGNAFKTEEDAVIAASFEAMDSQDLHRCDNCGKLHTDNTLKIAKHLTERVGPNGPMPSGECSDPDCGALCYLIEKDPDWQTVMSYFGLDGSFVWTPKLIQEYTQQYIKAIADEDRQKALGLQAIETLRQIREQPNCRHEVEAQLGGEVWDVLQSAPSGKATPVALGLQGIELLKEADAYLRDIRAENLDGSEPALGTLLGRVTDFWVDMQPDASPQTPDLGDVAEWVGQHYKVNFDAEPADRKADWVERFSAAHN